MIRIRVMVLFVWCMAGLAASSLAQTLAPAPAGAPAPAPAPAPATPAGQGGAPAGGEAAAQPGGRSGGPAAAPLPKGTFALTTAGRVVPNIEKTLEFYRNVFGLLPYGTVPPRPQMNQAIAGLSNLPDSRFRQITIGLPNSGLLMRLIEFANVEQTPKTPQAYTDPGQAYFHFEVSDIDAVVSNLQRGGARFVSPPTAQAARTATALLVRDSDGYLLEITKGVGSQGTNIGAGASPVLESRYVLTADSTDATLKFYRDLVGASIPKTSDWQRAPFGSGEMRWSRSDDIGGPGRVLEIREYRNAGAKTPMQVRVQDPGATLLSFLVHDLAELIKMAQAANLRVVTPEGKPVRVGNLDRVIVQDPDGVFVELIQE